MKGLRDFVLAPAAPRPSREVPAAPPVPAVVAGAAPLLGLITERRDACALGTGAALLAAGRRGCGLLAIHDAVAAESPGPARSRAWTTPAARRLAGSLAARDLAASAGGRLVTLTLPAEGAATAAERALAAAEGAGAAFVLVVAGPRTRSLDAVLARCDAVAIVVPSARAGLAGLAAGTLDGLAPATAVAVVDLRPLDRLLARAALAVPRELRAALAPLLEQTRRPA